jgi:hypothetical protein
MAGMHSGRLIVASHARNPIDSGQMPELIIGYAFPPWNTSRESGTGG